MYYGHPCRFLLFYTYEWPPFVCGNPCYRCFCSNSSIQVNPRCYKCGVTSYYLTVLLSRDLAVAKIKEAQETYSLKSRCFLESTGIYHIPLLCFLRDKGFDCSVINPIITKNSTNINIRKLHNDKFDSKKAALVGLNVSLKTSIIPDDSVVDLRNLVRDYYYFKDLQSAVALKLTAELKVSFPAYAKVFSKVTTQSSLKLLSSYPLAEDMLAASKDDIVKIIRSTARFGEAYALRKYDTIIAAAQV